MILSKKKKINTQIGHFLYCSVFFFSCIAKAKKQVVRPQKITFLAAKSLINFLWELRCDLEKGKLNARKFIPEHTKKSPPN